MRKGRGCKLVEPLITVGEFLNFARNRQPSLTDIGRAVIIENAKQFLVGGLACARNAFDEVRIEFYFGTKGGNSQVSAVDEDSNLLKQMTPQTLPFGGSNRARLRA